MNIEDVYKKQIEAAVNASCIELLGVIVSNGVEKDIAHAVSSLSQITAYNAIKRLFNNLWISVDDALPDKQETVFVHMVNIKINEHDYYQSWITDYGKFAIETEEWKAAHWMCIPKIN